MLIKNVTSRFLCAVKLFVVVTVLLLPVFSARPAQAFCWCVLDICQDIMGDFTRDLIADEHDDLRDLVTEQFKQHQLWLVEDYLPRYIVPQLVLMTEQFTTVAMHQMLVLGTMMDAKIQMETQRLYQQKTAEAHKKYQPSTGMCTIGTAVRSLAASDSEVNYAKYLRSQSALDRHLGHTNSSAAPGPAEDLKVRVQQFREYYCDPRDSNNNLNSFCGSDIPETVNKDIDFTRTAALPSTLNINYTNRLISGDERDIAALSKNLFGSQVFIRPDKAELAAPKNMDEYIDMRALMAKRSVAENSFHSYVALKAGSSNSARLTGNFLENILRQLGINEDEEIRAYLGSSPSYYAQMEILAQKIYQSPDFYTNLYDKPANVARKDVAMQAIDLMLDRDSYKSELRTEALLSMLLEMDMIDLQKQVQWNIDSMFTGGRKEE